MFRTTDMVLIAVMVCAAGFTYTTKHAAEAELSKVRKLESAIRFEEETIDVLKADWSLLTQPSRLQRLAEAYREELHLAPVEAHQIAEIDELPARPLRIEDIVGEDRIAADGIDGVTTGGVAQ
ncbi:MAG: hypothetical protein IH590_18845 [Aquamicrobium sp.]|nr:hypothetical protein [Aquamicrobium sp.]